MQTIVVVFLVVFTYACQQQNKEPERLKAGSMNTASFDFDRRFLQQNDSGIIQLKSGSSSILVSAKFQGKVFTSTTSGDTGRSLGWINYRAFSGGIDPHMNAYGGENRFWLGPEGGKFSLYFAPGKQMIFDNWKTPAPIDIESWGLVRKTDTSVLMRKPMMLSNYSGYTLSMLAERSVAIRTKEQIESTFGIEIGDSVNYVGYSTMNTLFNTGDSAWTDTTGMPCIWILDMFNPSPATTVVIPFRPSDGQRVATTDYFGQVGRSRLQISDSVIYFRADGRKRSKIGVLPRFVLPVAGSFDAHNNILTITYFSVDNEGRYLNQVWNTDNDVFTGDAMNAYNDGPLDDGSQMGPFYEIESVSPAASLRPGESISHRHDVYHFTGKKQQLDSIATRVLGVSLETIERSIRR